MNEPNDVEITALAEMWERLARFNSEARRRMIGYLSHRSERSSDRPLEKLGVRP